MDSSAPVSIKSIEYSQDGKTYKIDLAQRVNTVIFSVKDINEIDKFYKLEIGFEDIQNKIITFRIYKSVVEFTNALENFISNKNVSLEKKGNSLIFNIFIFNIMNGNKEIINFELKKTENTNKDEIIKQLCLKVNNLEEKYNNLEEKYKKLEKNYEEIMTVIGDMIIEKKSGLFRFQWENHENCLLSNNNKKLKKIKNEGWNTNIKGNKILRKNSKNIFKIRVNNIHLDKTGLYFGIAKASTIFSSFTPFNDDWNICCKNTTDNSKFRTFVRQEFNKGDIATFIVDLLNGILEVKKNDISLGKINNIPSNEDLVPCVCNYYVGNEIEIIED